MFGLGIWEFVIVVIVGLLVLGPRKLPQVAAQIGKLMREFRRATHDLRRGLDDAVDPADTAPPDYSPPPKPPSLTELGTDTPSLPGTVAQSDASSEDAPSAGDTPAENGAAPVAKGDAGTTPASLYDDGPEETAADSDDSDKGKPS